jgi:hypothetical protein
MLKYANRNSPQDHSGSARDRESESLKIGAARKITADLQGIQKSAKSENASCRKGYNRSERDIEMRKSANASSRKGHSRSATERESESPKIETARTVTVDPQRIWNLRVDNGSCRKDHNKLARHGETRKGGNGSSPRGRSRSARNVEMRKSGISTQRQVG